MILGETLVLREEVSASAAFVVASATIDIYNAAGTKVVDNQSAAVDDTDTDTQIITYAFTPAATGRYTAAFKVTVGSEVRLFRQQVVVESVVPLYPGVYPYIRTRLQDSLEGIEDSELDGEIAAALAELLAAYPDESFEDTTGSDRTNLEEAVGKFVAARMLVPYTTGGADGPLTQERTDKTMRQFAADQSERNRWERESRAAFARLSFVIARAYERRGSGGRFGLAGRRRTLGEPDTVAGMLLGESTEAVDVDPEDTES